jgi:hypothetical protein
MSNRISLLLAPLFYDKADTCFPANGVMVLLFPMSILSYFAELIVAFFNSNTDYKQY